MDIVYIIVGLLLVVFGANFLTDGASGIATRFGVSDFLVGVTVVAIGTSTPELVVSVLSSIRGEDAIAVGNVVGSNLFNTLLIVGVTAIITPLALTRENIMQDIPFGILATLVLVVCAADPWLSGDTAPVISRTEGVMMLFFFVVFIAYTIYSGLSPKRCSPSGTPSATQENDGTPTKRGHKMWLLIVMTLGGLAGLIFGGEMFLDGAVKLAHRLGISDTVIAVTIIAGGTSLPELAASLVAAIKGKTGIALGNILGSNVFNIFLVLGASATVGPLTMGDITTFDLLFVLLSAVLLLVAAFTFRKKEIDRTEGVLFVLLFIGYIVWLLKR